MIGTKKCTDNAACFYLKCHVDILQMSDYNKIN